MSKAIRFDTTNYKAQGLSHASSKNLGFYNRAAAWNRAEAGRIKRDVGRYADKCAKAHPSTTARVRLYAAFQGDNRYHKKSAVDTAAQLQMLGLSPDAVEVTTECAVCNRPADTAPTHSPGTYFQPGEHPEILPTTCGRCHQVYRVAPVWEAMETRGQPWRLKYEHGPYLRHPGGSGPNAARPYRFATADHARSFAEHHSLPRLVFPPVTLVEGAA